MKKIAQIRFYLLLLSDLFGQTNIVAEKESLGIIYIGERPAEIQYAMDEEGFFSPGGIFVDSEGGLFFIQNFRSKPILRFFKGKFEIIPLPKNIPSTWFGPASYGISQYGICGEGSFFFTLKNGNYQQTDFYDKAYMKPARAYSYPTPWGAIWESVDHKQLVSAEFKVGENAKIRDLAETRSWLLTQPGGFSIGEDGLLYRNGVLWSAILPKGYDGARYLGKLASGHNIWASGIYYGMESWFSISNAEGQVELTFYVPWKYDNGKETITHFNYGVGPWGELYCLIAPPLIPSGKKIHGGDGYIDEYIFDSSVPAELVVVRNHLRYFGRLNDGGVRLRKEPTTASEILGTYPVKTGFRILEKGEREETIGGQRSVWYKVRLLDGTEGWFFGAYVQNLYDGPNGKAPPWPNVPDW